jgi:tetratricopeptide (TPR) repeat protein
MLATIFQEEITPDFLDAIYKETDGNPFFIEEICYALVESGKVFYVDGAWDRFSIEELEIPQGIQIAIESRLARMDESCQEVVRMAAVIGREFNVFVLQEALGMAEDALIGVLESAENAHLIQEAVGKSDVAFSFVHALVPQVIRESIHIMRKRQMHNNVAVALEKFEPENYESLAFHHSKAGNDDKTLIFTTLAGQRALNAFSNQEAEKYFFSALDLVGEEKSRSQLLSQLGTAQMRLGKIKSAIQTCSEAITIYLELKDYDQAAYLYALCGRIKFSGGDTPGNLSICEEGLEILKGAPASPGMAILLSEYGRSLIFNLKVEEGLEASKKALKMAEKIAAVEVQVQTLISIASWGNISIEESHQLFIRAIELAEGANLWSGAARAHNNFSIHIYFDIGDYKKGYKHLKKGIELTHQIGDLAHEFFSLSNVKEYFGITCDFQTAEEILNRMSQLLKTMPDLEIITRMNNLSEANLRYLRDRDILKAVDIYRDCIDYFRKVDDYQAITKDGFHLAYYLMQIEEYSEGEKIIREAIQIAKQGVFIYNKIPRYLLVVILGRMGKLKAAREEYEKALSEHNKEKTKRTVNILWLNTAEANLLVAERKWELAWMAYDQLVSKLDMIGNIPAQIINLTDWAKAHLLRGEDEDKQRARELYGKALKVSEEMNANGWVEYIKDELGKLGQGSDMPI